ncbi:MAG: thermonuclease family protein [Acidothermales bacterium]|nr:thermonuclease family protein [Acidothermales bacterium]
MIGLAATALLLLAGCAVEGDSRSEGEAAAVAKPGKSKPARSKAATPATPKASAAATQALARARNRSPAALPRGDDGQVTRHVDGDTVYVDGVSVRLIGIDTPETVRPGSAVECYGREASGALTRLLPLDERVRVVYDVERQDRYGRDLAYIYRARDGLFVNLALVRNGYASAYTVPPNVAHAGDFTAAARRARASERGLWDTCADERTPTPQPPPAQALPLPKRLTDPAGRCEPGYQPCVPPYPPGLDCADVDGPVRVFGSDPHGLDGDGDGVACEP